MIFSSYNFATNEGPLEGSSGAIPNIPLYQLARAISLIERTSKKEKPVSTQISLPQLVSKQLVSIALFPTSEPISPKGIEVVTTGLFLYVVDDPLLYLYVFSAQVLQSYAQTIVQSVYVSMTRLMACLSEPNLNGIEQYLFSTFFNSMQNSVSFLSTDQYVKRVYQIYLPSCCTLRDLRRSKSKESKN